MNSKQDNEVILEEVNDIGVITLNRPQRLNALSSDMILSMRLQLEKWQKTDRIKGVIIKSNSEKAFCSGGDVRESYHHILNDKDISKKAIGYFQGEYQLDDLIATYPKPIISLIDGLWMGGGVGISLNGSCRVVSEKAEFAMPETIIGFIPDVGSNYYLARLPSQIGKLLAMTAMRINANEALSLKLANAFVPHKKFGALYQWLINDANWRRPLHTQIKKKWYELPPCSNRFSTALRRKIRHIFKPNHAHDIYQNLCASPWPEAQDWLEMMQGKSPLSQILSVELQHRAKDMAITDTINMEFLVAQSLAHKNSDFIEGVRAQLIDKDRTPNWHIKSLDALTPQQLDSYFSSKDKSQLHEVINN